jgi:phospholipase D-like protein
MEPAMFPFDIQSLIRFSPPKYLCRKCYGLWVDSPYNHHERRCECPVCGVRYINANGEATSLVLHYLKENGLCLSFPDLIGHSQELAEIARELQWWYRSDPDDDEPETWFPIHSLLKSLQSAQRFVHFSTWGISPVMLGALKMTAMRIPVRGIISNTSEYIADELQSGSGEVPHLSIVSFDKSTPWKEPPHQKIIIIDGLFAFKGSANLTENAWRKSAVGLDQVETVTDIQQVLELNNRFFSPIWAKYGSYREMDTFVYHRSPFDD